MLSLAKGEVGFWSWTEFPRFKSQFCWTLGKPHIVIQISLLPICKILGKSFNHFFCSGFFSVSVCIHTHISHYLLLLYIIVFNYIYNGKIFSHKNEILPFEAAWMYLEGIKWNKSDRERQMLYYFSYVDIKKNRKNEQK